MNEFPLQPICKCWAPNLKIAQIINEFASKVEDKNAKRHHSGAKWFLNGMDPRKKKEVDTEDIEHFCKKIVQNKHDDSSIECAV